MLTVLTANGPSGYAVKNSLRFRSSASAYLSRTPAAASNQQTWTYSCWMKLGPIGTGNQQIFGTRYTATAPSATLFRTNAGVLDITQYTSGTLIWAYSTSQVFRDPSSWYHFVLVLDTTQAVASNRIRLYINGVQSTLTANTAMAQNVATYVNSTAAHGIGALLYGDGSISPIQVIDSYMAEVNFIDGQALTPSSFGAFDATSGVWQPTRYSGTYGTNGFYLKFTDTTSTTTLCYDYSGNSNNWTPNNISLTAGSTYDSMLDSPTNYDNGGNGVGNYCTLNPLQPASTTVVVPTDGNLKMTGTASGNNVTGTMAVAVATYFEGTVIAGGGTVQYGVKNLATDNVYVYDSSGNKSLAGSSSAYGATFTTNDVIGIAVDPVNLTLQFYKNNVSQGVISSAFPSGSYVPFFYASNTNSSAANFGQRPFAYTPPTGYKALCTQNLPAPAIYNGSNFMAATTYTGNGTSQTVTNAVNGVSFTPDFVWVKNRANSGADHALVDSVRGAAYWLASNLTQAESNNTAMVTSINSNGFTVGASNMTNQSGVGLVGWQWKAGGTAVSNTSGTITSSVSANTTAGFSVVTFTAQSSGTGTVGHGLGVAPSMIILKQRAQVGAWGTYHISLGNTQRLLLNTTDAAVTTSTYWNNTSPTSSVFTIGTGFATAGTMVAYCFAAIPGYSAFGSYTGNGSADGPFVYTGFRPRFVMIKSSSAAYNWHIFDSSRNTYNVVGLDIQPNLSDAEADYSPIMDFLSNGFKLRTGGAGWNDANTYIYAAFAESPLKFSLAR